MSGDRGASSEITPAAVRRASGITYACGSSRTIVAGLLELRQRHIPVHGLRERTLRSRDSCAAIPRAGCRQAQVVASATRDPGPRKTATSISCVLLRTGMPPSHESMPSICERRRWRLSRVARGGGGQRSLAAQAIACDCVLYVLWRRWSTRTCQSLPLRTTSIFGFMCASCCRTRTSDVARSSFLPVCRSLPQSGMAADSTIGNEHPNVCSARNK